MSETREGPAKLSEGVINDESLAAFRKRIGAKFPIRNLFNQEACKDSIRKFADGIGDPNPLWRDEEYAGKTRYGRIAAPPNWLYSVYPTWVQQGLPGVHAFHSGNDWEFYKPVLSGDVITPEATFTGFDIKQSRFSGRLVMEYQEAKYFNEKRELVAKAKTWITRAERRAAREAGKYSEIQLPHPWTEEELRSIEDEVLAEEVRGGRPRYWEDVAVGDKVGPVVKGPFGLTDMIAYCIGASPEQCLAHGLALRLYRKHPAWAFRDPTTHALEPGYAVHYNTAAANGAGLPYPYDVGAQRHCWLIHLLTNWMGDDGWLKRNYGEYRRFFYFSDVVWFRGTVTRKYVDQDGEHCVDIETSGFNQRGENIIPGQSTVALPSREAGSWPVERRLG